MSEVTMIMPMAGRGSRFAKSGVNVPKPLIELFGRPFFEWATLGVLKAVPDARLVYVVLQEHVSTYSIDSRVLEVFPSADILVVPDITAGALTTALIGLNRVSAGCPILINDCDHAFSYSKLPGAIDALRCGAVGFLTHFRSDQPHFSYAAYDSRDRLVETVEKRVIGNRAIAGIYGFRDCDTLRTAAEGYSFNCPYPELYVSGVYNELVARGGLVRGFDLDLHVPFGTPGEMAFAENRVAFFEDLLK